MAFTPDPDTGQPGTIQLADGSWAYRWKDSPDTDLIPLKQPEAIYVMPPPKG
ncbi:hypothetical protein [Rhodococcus sp. ARC_M6]|uniref:hypothetical protein n=1 Tax=Rhodococcus sp. ARC_M6 TaxID=2928852 RepID=UPI001FB1A568|nr:hypothetical protein [Rhodococcus sp. ARC_M6]MCJ0906208.1 hypothetical protein [Rhodococcus sp. ARC_M6]